MRIDILTIFPDMFAPVLESSMLRLASEKGLIEFYVHNIRDYAENKHKNTDDYPFGGGAGMVMMAQPIVDCLESIPGVSQARRACLTPRGKVLTPDLARELSKEAHIVLLCGHYEGIDERVMDRMTDEISIGDYVLTGGELPAMVLIDCLSRFIPGVLGSSESAEDESFSGGLLEYPQYTRPADFRGEKVPAVLLGGNHAEIRKWRRQEALRKTWQARLDLLSRAKLEPADKVILDRIQKEEDIF